ncbi:MAG: HAD family hydrolase [Prevotella sp.]|jgi:phosphoglycolate phosphatase|nr:HAD family hydrolase [Prevotella sp.]
MKYRAVILDFDGTMGDTRSLIVKTMQQTIAELHLPHRTEEQCASMIGLPLKQTFLELIPMSDEMGDRCAETYRRLFFENNQPGVVPVFPHVIETIEALYAKGVLLTIASSRSRESLNEFLEEMKLNQYIRYVISANDIEHAKPAPDMVLRTLNDHHLQPEEALVVGDTKYDVLMAHRAGVKAVGVTYGNGSREELEQEQTDYIINDFSELLKFV